MLIIPYSFAEVFKMGFDIDINVENHLANETL